MHRVHSFIKNLQEKSYETRTRILWASSTVIGLLIVSVWFTNFKNDIKDLTVSSVTTNQTQASNQHYLNISAFEKKDKNLHLYFSIKNDTTDILNFSKTTDITLKMGNRDFRPAKITSRTNQPFVQKALSHSDNFGILIFEDVEGDKGTVTFDNMFFEQSPANLFHEVIDINLDNLSKPTDLGN